jgi:hypothetical protein
MRFKVKEIKDDIWNYHAKGTWICVTTNGFVKKNGEAVMGRGIALQAKIRFPDLPMELGRLIKSEGNRVLYFTKYRLITLPVKHNWFENADLGLIDVSIRDLATIREDSGYLVQGTIYLPRAGCQNGNLNWKDVKPIYKKYLNSTFVVVDLNG